MRFEKSFSILLWKNKITSHHLFQNRQRDANCLHKGRRGKWTAQGLPWPLHHPHLHPPLPHCTYYLQAEPLTTFWVTALQASQAPGWYWYIWNSLEQNTYQWQLIFIILSLQSTKVHSSLCATHFSTSLFNATYYHSLEFLWCSAKVWNIPVIRWSPCCLLKASPPHPCSEAPQNLLVFTSPWSQLICRKQIFFKTVCQQVLQNIHQFYQFFCYSIS